MIGRSGQQLVPFRVADHHLGGQRSEFGVVFDSARGFFVGAVFLLELVGDPHARRQFFEISRREPGPVRSGRLAMQLLDGQPPGPRGAQFQQRVAIAEQQRTLDPQSATAGSRERDVARKSPDDLVSTGKLGQVDGDVDIPVLPSPLGRRRVDQFVFVFQQRRVVGDVIAVNELVELQIFHLDTVVLVGGLDDGDV